MPRFAILTCSLLALSCGEHDSPAPCTGPAAPAFRVTVAAPRGAGLPADTRLTVAHGGGVEEWSLQRPGAARVIFCTPRTPDGGGGAVLGVECELWTDGAADVTVAGGAYPPLETTLAAERGACGFETVEAALTLGEADGGA